MSAYAYRWADGTVTICTAENTDEALDLLDQIGGVSDEALVKLDAPILITLKPDIRGGWIVDKDESIDCELSIEVQERVYPKYRELYWKIEEEEGDVPKFFTADQIAALEKALETDIEEAQRIDELIRKRFASDIARLKKKSGKPSSQSLPHIDKHKV
jgi:hypothetical protein